MTIHGHTWRLAERGVASIIAPAVDVLARFISSFEDGWKWPRRCRASQSKLATIISPSAVLRPGGEVAQENGRPYH